VCRVETKNASEALRWCKRKSFLNHKREFSDTHNFKSFGRINRLKYASANMAKISFINLILLLRATP